VPATYGEGRAVGSTEAPLEIRRRHTAGGYSPPRGRSAWIALESSSSQDWIRGIEDSVLCTASSAAEEPTEVSSLPAAGSGAPCAAGPGPANYQVRLRDADDFLDTISATYGELSEVQSKAVGNKFGR
jgi:hypothetical protein